MNGRVKNSIYNRQGFTLVELVISVPLIAMVILLGYNMFFLAQNSLSYVSRTVDVTEELRFFQKNIYSEANRAKKAEEEKDALHRISSTEIYIYTDVDDEDGRNIPELVRYRLVSGNLQRDVKKPQGTEYPYTYTSDFGTAETVLRNISNTDIFSEQEPIRIVSADSQESPDYRRKLRMRLVIEGEPNDIEVQGYLISKSRTESE
jgi:prepilin-type N-terminal cleavage/methylation domain-containing protein